MKVETILETNRSVLASFCRKHHITRLSLFGSTLKGEATASSDIDLLVEFHTDHIPGLIALAGMEIELSKLLGHKVDLRTAQDLSIYFRDEVLKEAREQYAEA
jgi:predicted nucleotidyltransferase